MYFLSFGKLTSVDYFFSPGVEDVIKLSPSPVEDGRSVHKVNNCLNTVHYAYIQHCC